MTSKRGVALPVYIDTQRSKRVITNAGGGESGGSDGGTDQLLFYRGTMWSSQPDDVMRRRPNCGLWPPRLQGREQRRPRSPVLLLDGGIRCKYGSAVSVGYPVIRPAHCNGTDRLHSSLSCLLSFYFLCNTTLTHRSNI